MKKTIALFSLLSAISCNYSPSLKGRYIPKIRGDTSSHKPSIYLELKKNGKAELRYSDTVINGSWEEFDVQEFNYVELIANGKLEDLHIIKDSINILELYIVGNASDFRGNHYDSLKFLKRR